MCAAGECMFCRYRLTRTADVETGGTAQGTGTEERDAQGLPPERNTARSWATERRPELSSC